MLVAWVMRARRPAARVLGALMACGVLAGCANTIEAVAPTSRIIDGGITQVTLTVPVVGNNVRADMYLPASSSPLPGVLVLPTYYAMVFGRSENFDRSYAIELAKRGYATLVPVLNQFGPRAYNPAHEADLVAISKWFRDRPEVMDDRIAAVGFSVGVHHANTLAAADPTVRAVVGYYGVYDNQGNAVFSEDKKASATNRVAQINAPNLILYGDKDNELPVEFAVIFRDKLKASGKTVEMVTYPGDYHRFDRGPSDVMNGRETDRAGHIYRLNAASRDDAWRRATAWLDTYMR